MTQESVIDLSAKGYKFNYLHLLWLVNEYQQSKTTQSRSE